MATFNTSKFVATSLTDLSGVVAETKAHFEGQGYKIEALDSSYGYFISLTKGGIFKSVLGMKTSLNIDIKRVSGGVSIDAKVGIFAQQAIPSLIMLFIAWPVLLTQITGLVQQAKLDDEAIGVIENAIRRGESGATVHAQSEDRFCTQCGASVAASANFCSACGAKRA